MRSPLSPFSSALVIICLFHYFHSNRIVKLHPIVLLVGTSLLISNTSHFFNYLVILYPFLMSVQDIWLFLIALFVIFCWIFYLFIYSRYYLFVQWLASKYSLFSMLYFHSWLFLSLYRSLCMQCNPIFLFLLLLLMLFKSYPKNCLYWCSERFFLYIFFSFIDSGFGFNSSIHFELPFANSERYMSHFIHLYLGIQASFMEEIGLSPKYVPVAFT